MDVKLDWEIEAEQVAYNNLSEHRQDVRQRRANYRRALLAILLVSGLVLGVIGVFVARLTYVDSTIEQQLRDTVAAEVAALRIGDIAAYIYVQRSESDAWMLGQTNLFWRYQQDKLAHDIQLTGEVLDLEIDENRARVVVEEIVDGQPYEVLWFYWRYEDGWRHVPMDVTFWGGDATYTGEAVTIRYGKLDKTIAETLGPALDAVWSAGCQWLSCSSVPPPLMVDLMPDASVGVSWSPDDADVLRIASPWTAQRKPADMALAPDVARQIGRRLASRLLSHIGGGFMPAPGTDAEFIYNALEDWLVGRFLGDGGTLGSSFIESLVAAYGEAVTGTIVHNLQPDSSIGVLASILTTSLDALPVEWREFFQWRLALEPYLLAQGEQAQFLALYDDLAQNEAAARLADPASAGPALPVVRVVVGPGSDGVSRAWAVVQYPDGSEGPITFRLVDGNWRRSVPDNAYVP